jgi:hypothetical protein
VPYPQVRFASALPPQALLDWEVPHFQLPLSYMQRFSIPHNY